jgi:hypothetical protein
VRGAATISIVACGNLSKSRAFDALQAAEIEMWVADRMTC